MILYLPTQQKFSGFEKKQNKMNADPEFLVVVQKTTDWGLAKSYPQIIASSKQLIVSVHLIEPHPMKAVI